jgi:hypothetical protein
MSQISIYFMNQNVEIKSVDGDIHTGKLTAFDEVCLSLYKDDKLLVLPITSVIWIKVEE